MITCRSRQTLKVASSGAVIFYMSYDHPGDPVSDGGGDYHYTDEVNSVAMKALFANPFDKQPGYPQAGIVLQGTQLGPAAPPDDKANTLLSDLTTVDFDNTAVDGVNLFGWFKVNSSGGIDTTDTWIVGVEWGDPGWPIFSTNFSPNFSLVINLNSGQARFDLWNDLGAQNSLTHFFSPPDNVWQFLCATYDTKTGDAKLYINGSTPVSSGNLGLLNGTWSSAKFAQGLDAGNQGNIIDECGISFKAPYSDTQVAQLYNSGSGISWPAVNSV